MIGKTKLSTIRAEVRPAFAKAGLDPDQWFEQEIRKREGQPTAEPSELETLRMIRDALADAVKAGPRKSRRRARSR